MKIEEQDPELKVLWVFKKGGVRCSQIFYKK